MAGYEAWKRFEHLCDQARIAILAAFSGMKPSPEKQRAHMSPNSVRSVDLALQQLYIALGEDVGDIIVCRGAGMPKGPGARR